MSTTFEPRRRRRLPTPAAEKTDRHVGWNATAPKELKQAGGLAPLHATWKTWGSWLAKRRAPKLPRLFRSADSPLLTAADELLVGDAHSLIELLWRAARGKRRAAISAGRQLRGWLADASGTLHSRRHALECVAWCHALPQLASQTGAEPWWRLFWHLMDCAAEARQAPDGGEPLATTLLAAELPLTLATQFPEIDDCQLGAAAALAWFQGQLTDPQAEERQFAPDRLHLLRPTLACWTRTRALSRKWLNRRISTNAVARARVPQDLNRDAAGAFRRLTLAVMRWTSGDGRQLLTPTRSVSEESTPHAPREAGHHAERDEYYPTRSTSAPTLARSASEGVRAEHISHVACDSWSELKRLLSHAVVEDGSRSIRRTWKAYCKQKPAADRRAGKRRPPGNLYEASAAAVLRSRWWRRGAALAVAFDRQPLQLELHNGRRCLLHGAWTSEVRCQGEALGTAALPWDVVCWEADRKAQWLEIELQLAGGVRIERGMLLAPRDEFLLLMDTVVGPRGEPMEFVSRLPLAVGMRAEPAAETAELMLRGERRLARVLPLALGEWRSDSRNGRLAVVDGNLELRQQSRDGALCATLLIDYSRQRRKDPLTWRQLTVGEAGQPVGRDVAAGYRVQIGRRQWLIYRSLRSVAHRTVLGQNLATELLVARFHPDGNVKTLVEIE